MNLEYPLRHLSVRVPWHDAGWNGTVCNAPELNGACVKLKNIAAQKRDEEEKLVAGEKIFKLSYDKWPSCVSESAAFMAPFPMNHRKRHPLIDIDPPHYGHLQATNQMYPAYSASVVPFRWMMRGEYEALGERLELDVDATRENDLGYRTNWVNEVDNQTALLNGFSAHFRPESSLVFFYAKQVPFVEQTGRILIGVGRVKGIGKLSEYIRESESDGIRSMIWERPIEHSIRPAEDDGFLMPYQKIIQWVEENPKAPPVNWEAYTAFTPPENRDEFSYSSEHITHDGAISALLSMDSALGEIEKKFNKINTEKQRQWINEQLSRLWKTRGQFPGLGAVLNALNVPGSTLRAHTLQKRAGEANDPWGKVDEMFSDPKLPDKLREPARTWRKFDEERRRFLSLLSRFNLSNIQAKRFCDESEEWDVKDRQVLDNPYILYEASRQTLDGISPMTVDRGIFPSNELIQHDLLETSKSFHSTEDLRRVHAFVVYALEKAALDGHTWQSCGELGKTIRDITAPRECQVNKDILSGLGDLSDIGKKSEVVSIDCKDTSALQLERYWKIRDLVREKMADQINGERSTVKLDWRELISEKLDISYEGDEDTSLLEQESALKELAESNFSVLVGPAGTGKTTLLGLICSHEEILKGGVLILAPTGKARVGAHKLVNDYIADGSDKDSVEAMTIAQFLSRLGRYKWDTNQYLMDGKKVYRKSRDYKTVIIDEASMITEDMFGSTLEALVGVKRWILVGDPAQLPPIGAGRPFFDIFNKLRPPDIVSKSPRVAPGYAELTHIHRQENTESCASRWAQSFSINPPSDDDNFELKDDCRTRFVKWSEPEKFPKSLIRVLSEELKLEDKNDQHGFNRWLGGEEKLNKKRETYYQFNKGEAVKKVESWQILSPLRGMPFGVNDINRQIHEHFRRDQINYAKESDLTPDPMGAEQIVYGDKVINLINHKHKISYESESGYIANGEIGIAAGALNPKLLRVEFSSQIGNIYDFKKSQLDSENRVYLELAYALTVHKAQGSQFDLVILVLPLDYREFRHELIYTALTRHKKRLVVMHQKPLNKLRGLRELTRSATEERLTNLFD